MKKNIFFPFLVSFFLVFSFSSCRKKVQIDKTFEIKLELISFNNKEIQVFYLKNVDDSYTEENSIKKFVSGSEIIQEVTFKLEDGIKPKNIRIDFSDLPNDSLYLKSVSFKYKDQFLRGEHDLYDKWFDVNNNIIYSQEKDLYFFKIYNQTFDPSFVGNLTLNSQLVKLYVPDVYEFNSEKN